MTRFTHHITSLCLLAVLLTPKGEAEDVFQPPPLDPTPEAAAREFTRPADVAPGAYGPLAALIEVGDHHAALKVASSCVQELTGRPRQAAEFALATSSMHAGLHREGAEALTSVIHADGPLAPWASWQLAQGALEREDAPVALATCLDYAERWPSGPHADRCVAVVARASAMLGRPDEARAAAQAWRRIHPRDPIDASVDLLLALASPADATDTLRRLATTFTAPTIGRAAARLLPPLTGADARAHASSLRDAGAAAEAWQAFQAIAADPDPAARAWVEAQHDTFAWKARAWEALEARYLASYHATPTSDIAWNGWRAASRGGRYADARRWMQEGRARWGAKAPWSGQDETFARTLILGGWPDEAAALLDPGASHTGSTGRRQLFLASFARWRGGRVDAAVEGFSRLVEHGGAYETEARYWRARALSAQDPFTAAHDRAWVLERAPDSWYAVLLRSDPTLPGPVHRGAWPATLAVGWSAPPISPEIAVVGSHPYGHARLGLPWTPPAAWRPPFAYPEGPHHDPEAGRRLLHALADGWGARWPALEAVADLADVGLYDLSGPLMSRWYNDWRTALHRRDPSARSLSAQIGDAGLLPAFLAARDHHHTAQRTWMLDRSVGDPEGRDATQRLAWPIAHGATVWAAAERADVDPWLVLALMRAESTYNPNAVSRVGARGPMQIMPRTGYLLADLADDLDFTPADLFDPLVAVDYGVEYLGLLRQRFGGTYPLAVAAYNAGPHNVGAWLEGLGPGTPVDEIVEAIPFHETRDYVRKVVSYYDVYTRLYEGRSVRVEWASRHQDPTIVDF